MFSSFQLSKKFIRYWLRASNGSGHGMHSPFVYGFIRNVLNTRVDQPECKSIEHLRMKLLDDNTSVPAFELGAGSRTGGKELTVKKIASSALKPKKYARLMYRLAKHYHPSSIIELGTSLGITTSYLAKGAPRSHIITVEGNPAIAEIAATNFQALDLKNIATLTGEFSWALRELEAQYPGRQYDLIYIDGNHRLQPTIEYFQYFLSHIHEKSILVFDDIHWSEEMERAWKEIKAHHAVRCTVDIFFLGFVFFRPEFKVKQHFEVRF